MMAITAHSNKIRMNLPNRKATPPQAAPIHLVDEGVLTKLGAERIRVKLPAEGRDARGVVVDGHIQVGIVSIRARLGAQVVVIVAGFGRAAKGELSSPATIRGKPVSYTHLTLPTKRIV